MTAFDSAETLRSKSMEAPREVATKLIKQKLNAEAIQGKFETTVSVLDEEFEFLRESDVSLIFEAIGNQLLHCGYAVSYLKDDRTSYGDKAGIRISWSK